MLISTVPHLEEHLNQTIKILIVSVLIVIHVNAVIYPKRAKISMELVFGARLHSIAPIAVDHLKHRLQRYLVQVILVPLLTAVIYPTRAEISMVKES